MSLFHTDQTDRIGISYCENIITKMGLIFREQPIRDYGIDAHIETVNPKYASGKLVALQIKTGSSYFTETKNNSIVFRGELKHYEYWLRHSLPVILVLYNPETNECIWEHINSKTAKRTRTAWIIYVPRNNDLSKSKSLIETIAEHHLDCILDKELSQQLNTIKNDANFLNQLIEEKLAHCKELILKGNTKDASRTIETIYIASLMSLSDKNVNLLNYLKVLICLLENDIARAESLVGFLDSNNPYTESIKSVMGIKANGVIDFIVTDEIRKDLLLSYVALMILFDQGEYEYILDNFKPTDSSYHVHDFFYGISYMNIESYIESAQAFDMANKKCPTPKYLFCLIVAQININLSQTSRIDKDFSMLNTQYFQLIKAGEACPEFRNANSDLFNMAKLRILLVQNSELFLDEYNRLTQNQKDDNNFRFLLANFHQMQNQYEDAICIYKEISTKEPSPKVSYGMMCCLLSQQKFAEAIMFFESADTHQFSATIDLYLTAIHHQNPEKFDDLFMKHFLKKCNDVEDLSFFLELSHYSSNAKNAIYIKVKDFKHQILISATKKQKLMVAFFAAEMADIELSESILTSISEYSSNDLKMVDSMLYTLLSLEQQEAIARWFVDNNLKTSIILYILANCYMKKEKNTSAFSLLQEAFALKKDKNIAEGLIYLALLSDSVRINDVQEYLDHLIDNKKPEILLNIAHLYCRFGIFDKAEKISYEALYLLSNLESSDLYKVYLSVHFNMLRLGYLPTRKTDYDRVVNDTVVTLISMESEQAENTHLLIICINQEAEFCNDTESIGALHISKSSLLYLKMNNKHVNDKIEHNGQSYRIASILCKYVYTFRYVFSAVEKLNDGFFIKTIRKDSSKDFVQQIKEALQEIGSSKNQLDLYHFKNNPCGLPIESIYPGRYDDYVGIVKTLLYSKEEVLYAGQNYTSFDINQEYTISLSSLVILGILNNLSIIEQYVDKIQISDSLLNFIKERSEAASNSLAISPGKIGLSEDGDIIQIPQDETIPDFWNSIYEISQKFNICNISSADRSHFIKLHSDIDIEKLFARINVHICQLDSFIIAERNTSILLSDDLFFRNLSGHLGIQSVNHTYFYSALKFEDINMTFEKLIKTNFLFIPANFTSESQEAEYFKSIFSNENKRRAYAELTTQIFRTVLDRLTNRAI